MPWDVLDLNQSPLRCRFWPDASYGAVAWRCSIVAARRVCLLFEDVAVMVAVKPRLLSSPVYSLISQLDDQSMSSPGRNVAPCASGLQIRLRNRRLTCERRHHAPARDHEDATAGLDLL